MEPRKTVPMNPRAGQQWRHRERRRVDAVGGRGGRVESNTDAHTCRVCDSQPVGAHTGAPQQPRGLGRGLASGNRQRAPSPKGCCRS